MVLGERAVLFVVEVDIEAVLSIASEAAPSKRLVRSRPPSHSRIDA